MLSGTGIPHSTASRSCIDCSLGDLADPFCILDTLWLAYSHWRSWMNCSVTMQQGHRDVLQHCPCCPPAENSQPEDTQDIQIISKFKILNQAGFSRHVYVDLLMYFINNSIAVA